MTRPLDRRPLAGLGWRLAAAAAVVSLLAVPTFADASASTHPAGTLVSSQRTETPSPTPTPTETPTVTATPTATPTATETPAPVVPDLRVVQANLESPQSVAGFQADAATVFAQQPDLITYNEVAFRYDSFLAPPPGYAMWRTPGQYTGATPVAWRTDKFTPIAQGTWMISDKGGRPPGKQTELGLRNANWVTLQGVDGRVLSLVSAHIAPKVDNWADLRRSSVERLTQLVTQLDDVGPVIIGGDFNMFHRGSGYPLDLFDAAGMVPSYDELGTRFATFDHGGAIIDYLFRAGSQLRATGHYPVELNSDHDAVVVDYVWSTDAPNTTTRVASNPDGTKAEKRAVAKAVNQRIAATRKGEHVWIHTSKFDYPLIYRSLVRAVKRGVRVHFVSRSPKFTNPELKLRAMDPKEKYLWVQKCGKKCTAKWSSQGRPTTSILVMASTGQAIERVDVSRFLKENISEKSTTATFSTGYEALAEAKGFFSKYM